MSIAEKLVTWTYYAFFLALVFYIFDSGGFQPAHGLLAIALVFAIPLYRKSLRNYRDVAFFAALFLFYFYLVAVVSFILDSDGRHIMAPVYYMTNILVMAVTLVIFFVKGVKFQDTLRTLCATVLILETFFILQGFGISVRSIGTFNNPNQLGYWSIMVFCLFAVCSLHRKIDMITILVLVCAAFCVASSLSKAAIAGMVFAFITFLFQKLSAKNALAFTIGIPLGLALLISAMNFSGSDIFPTFAAALERRVERTGSDTDDNAEARGYDRIWEHPKYLAFGAGEGGLDRFNTGSIERELHSSVGTLLFSYGFLGLGLFSIFLFRLLRFAPFSMLLYMVPPFAYGITHNGLRATMLWIFLAAVGALSRNQLTAAKVEK
jgi:MFS family permease